MSIGTLAGETRTYAKNKWILATVAIGAFISTFDGGVINVGLPTIASYFRTNINTVQWVTSVYLLAMSALLLIFGTMADAYGRRRIYNAGYFVITIFTLFCAFANSIGMLIFFRVLQAVGGSMVMANGMAIATENYPPSERGKNLGFLGTVVAIGSLAGPPLGGLVIGWMGWRAVFFLTFLVALAGFLASMVTIPRDRRLKEELNFDYTGALAVIIAIVTFIYGFSNANVYGWTSPIILVSIILFVASSLFLIFYERRRANAILDFQLFNNWTFTSSIIAALVSFITMYSPTVLIPFFYQKVLGFTPQKAGFLMMAFPAAMAVTASFSGWLSDKIGYVLLTTSGLVLNGLALVALANISLQTPITLIIIYIAVMGASLGMFQSPNNSCVMGSVPKNKLGAATGISQLIKNLGMVIGITFSVAIFSSRIAGMSLAYNQAFVKSMGFVYYLAAILSFAGAAISARRGK